MCGGHLLKFLNSHVDHKIGRKMTINLRSKKMPYEKQYINYYNKKTKVKGNEFENLAREAPHGRNLHGNFLCFLKF